MTTALPPPRCRLIASLALALAPLLPETSLAEDFRHDPADRTIEARLLDNAEMYDAGVTVWRDQPWMSCLEFVPGEGDRLRLQGGNDFQPVDHGQDTPGTLARPTLTVDDRDRLWLSYEILQDDLWQVVTRMSVDGKTFTPPRVISEGVPEQGNAVEHRGVAGSEGGLWFVWQADINGQFDIVARRVTADAMDEPQVISSSPRGDWQPDVDVGGDPCTACVVWDSHDGDQFNVLSRRCVEGVWQPITPIAAGEAFEARARVEIDRRGRTWVSWEEGATNWGKPYRSRPGPWDNMSDSYGPLHRYRMIRIARLDNDGTVRPLAEPLPMPAIDQACQREVRWEGIERTGAFYERGELVLDSSDRLWVVYRHFYRPELGSQSPLAHHIERGWQVFARCLEGANWSELIALDVLQRDGNQRLSVAATAEGLVVAYVTGRTDRRVDPHERGLAVAHIPAKKGTGSEPSTSPSSQNGSSRGACPLFQRATMPTAQPVPPRLAPAEVGGTSHDVVFGDLHRHTDLSLCFPYFDGSLSETYRYAIEVARLDFLGIADHARDLDNGRQTSQLWWRSTKEVTRHRLRGTFFPYFTYERSHGVTDHNVISLRNDMLRNFPPPLQDFWAEIDDGDTFTIPHAPIAASGCWQFQDDALRPLVEIYQGCRDYDSQGPANVGLRKGYWLGFIASSDHLSTAASYACVWTPRVDHEPIFRSMQQRRTYGATDKIRLVFRSGEHWMGERFTSEDLPEFTLELDGTAPIAEVIVLQDGVPMRRWKPEEQSASMRLTFTPGETFHGSHYFYVHAIQTDGNQAWSSPLWVTYENPNPPPEVLLREDLEDAENLALGKPVTVSFPEEITAGNPKLVTDGTIDAHLGHGTEGSAWAQVDLTEVKTLGVVRMWHYFADGRTYLGNQLAVSETGEFSGEEAILFDAATDGAYPETLDGKLLVFEPVAARYVRNTLSDNTVNPSTQWVEIEAYAP